MTALRPAIILLALIGVWQAVVWVSGAPPYILPAPAKVAAALAARWPQHADRFEAKLAELTEELTALDAGLQEAVADNPRMPVLFSHPVYQYLAHRYDLDARSVHFEPDQMPDQAALEKLVAMLGELPASWMIWENTPLPEIRERLESLGIRSVVFDSCARTPASGDFLSIMEENVQALRTVFAADSAKPRSSAAPTSSAPPPETSP